MLAVTSPADAVTGPTGHAPPSEKGWEGTCCSQDQNHDQDKDHLGQPAGVGSAFLTDLSVWGAPPKVTKNKSPSNGWEISLAAD